MNIESLSGDLRLSGRVVTIVPNTGNVDTVGVAVSRDGGGSSQGHAGKLGREGRHFEYVVVVVVVG